MTLTAITGIADTSQNVTHADFMGEDSGYIVVTSERDGLELLQGHRILVNVVSLDALLLETGDALLLETGDNLLIEA